LYTGIASGGVYMSKKLFNKEDRENLSKNRYVIHISEKAITYADEFKQLFINQYIAGKTPKEIFKDNGFDTEVIGKKRISQCAVRWKKAYETGGIIGLTDSRKGTSGRPLKRVLSQDEVIARQEARIRLLESQVELLKKLDMKERLPAANGPNLSLFALRS
jgi:putative transposase